MRDIRSDSIVGTAYLWLCRRLYHELAWSYDIVADLVSAGQWDAWRRSVLGQVRGTVVVELGCGTGALLPALARPGRVVLGIDASPAMLAMADRRPRQAGTHLPAAQATAVQLPVATGAVDTVVATFPAPYIFHPATLAEVRRVLRPGGRLVIGGLWVRWVEPHPLALLPVFYGRPAPARIAEFMDRMTAHGLEALSYEQTVGRAAVGCLIATPHG